MARKPDNDNLPDEIPMDLSGPAADNDGPTGDLTYLSMPWAKASASMQAKALQTSEINTFDEGRLARINGAWVVLKSGDQNDAEVVREALQKPN
ncbi:hypothetical protein [Mesorhizobium japonicum]|nr:hypothetical protein [Mesorhizobium japonicum]